MGERMIQNLVSESLFRAVEAKRPAQGLMHHSDRGSQYCSYQYRHILELCGMKTSMSMLKQELIYHCHFNTRQEARQAITEYIEVYYNRQRLQAKLGFLSPVAYVQKYYAGLLAS